MSTIKTPRKKHLELLLTNFTLLCSYNRKDTKAVINKTIFVKIKENFERVIAHCKYSNRPFPSSKNSRFQNEATIGAKPFL